MKIRTVLTMSSLASGKTIAINHTVLVKVMKRAGVARGEGYRAVLTDRCLGALVDIWRRSQQANRVVDENERGGRAKGRRLRYKGGVGGDKWKETESAKGRQREEPRSLTLAIESEEEGRISRGS